MRTLHVITALNYGGAEAMLAKLLSQHDTHPALANAAVLSLLAPGPIERMWTGHLGGRRNWSYHLWTILTFQSWMRYWQGSLTAVSAPTLAA